MQRGRTVKPMRAKRKVIPLGDCYRFAAKFVAKIPGEIRVVHGTVVEPLGRSKKRFHHAWVECGNLVFDWQTQWTKPDGIPAEVFQELWEPREHSRYTPSEARDFAISTKHWGPWP